MFPAKGAVVKVAAFGLGLILLVLPFAAQSDENLVDKREACRQQARLQIAPKGKVGVDGFRRIVERRAGHVRDCMSRPFVARVVQPLPPRRAPDAAGGQQEPATGSVGKKAPLIVKGTGGRKLQTRSVRSLKGRKSGPAKRGRPSRRHS
ncbi:hypothetical protein ILT44_14490 [Microvirga sp. BT689]|uniref:hypothetical protein n=1 Tax=Microvirga arvi TaxID=2778731 RepID=UPI001950AF4B|nr:hypothetical protein [Microvirga arvi]MBM6581401.1 hypothetical protein [Microvirga arvi]